MAANDQLSIVLSHANRFGQYRVSARCGNEEYIDFFNPADDYRRGVFAQNVISKFSWEESPEHFDAVNRAIAGELRRLEQEQHHDTEAVAMEPMASLQSGQIEWLWPGRIALGKLCVLAGDPGLGKSLLTLTIAATVSRGGTWPDVDESAPVGDVMLLNAEDDFVDTVRPRLEAAHSDLERIYAITGVSAGLGTNKSERSFDLSGDLHKLRERIERLKTPRLLIVDPVTSFLGSTSENANAEIRALLTPLARLAQEMNTAVILVSHLRKSKGSNLHRVIGSIAFAAIARSAFVVLRVTDRGPQFRKLVPVKSNIGAQQTAVVFHIRTDEGTKQPVVVWDSVEPHDGLRLSDAQRGHPPKIAPELVERLESALREGPKPFADLYALCDARVVQKRTLYRYVAQNFRWLEKDDHGNGIIALPEPGEDSGSRSQASGD